MLIQAAQCLFFRFEGAFFLIDTKASWPKRARRPTRELWLGRELSGRFQNVSWMLEGRTKGKQCPERLGKNVLWMF